MNIDEVKEYFKLDGYVIISLKELCSNIKKLDYIFKGNFVMSNNFNRLLYVSIKKGLSNYDVLTEVSYNDVLLNYATKNFSNNGLIIGNIFDDEKTLIDTLINYVGSDEDTIFMIRIKDLEKFFY
jgi:hypothetical protein|uniref:Uncharacterized protein n=1 Tax=Myoviridae sp. ctNQV2 TaxID=2827683 RepID=A0A8S5RZB4_9CAUD|nr:MAG: hypothetical protein [Bacteriophage sp.]UWI34537.1 MAG: hypothetical protein [Bacteriophage sp.]DAF44009.1 MAG TPA: hypothetical protein [Myoviridae sp. ctNQV2]